MKKALLIVLTVIAVQLNAQENPGRFDLRFGMGYSLMGNGDMNIIGFENELNFKISNYFSTAFALNYGRSNSGVYATTSFIQGNLNVFISPFRNNRKNDFRVGTGLTLMNVSDTYREDNYWNGVITEPYLDKRSAFGYNIIIEDSYSITDRFILGMKIFTQLYYTTGDINSGITVKFGVKL